MISFDFGQDFLKKQEEPDLSLQEALLRKIKKEGVAVCGLGKANLPLLEWLYVRGIRHIEARDKKRPAELSSHPILSAEGVTLLTGEGYLEGLTAGVIFRSPSLRPDTPALSEAARRGALILTEAALSSLLCPAKLFTVTGSDGKTTVTMLSGAILRAAGRRCFVGGNIGTPLLPFIDLMRGEDAAVMELSSFQLMDLCPMSSGAALTSFSENHLDWHLDLKEYEEAKLHGLLHAARAILPAECPLTEKILDRRPAVLFSAKQPLAALKRKWGKGPFVFLEGDTVFYEENGQRLPLFSKDALTLSGLYNLENAMCAAALCIEDATPAVIEGAIRAFRGAPHRCELIGCFRGIKCYDSSIDTTPTRSASTLSSFQKKPIVLCGGRGKKLSPKPLVEALIGGAKAAVFYGEIAPSLMAAVKEHPLYDRKKLPLLYEPLFDEAVKGALGLCQEGDCLLLSPAATAFDQFKNYEERGRRFAALCHTLS